MQKMEIAQTGIIECCNYKTKAREYFLEPQKKMSRSLFFIDECPVCGQPVAEVIEKDYNGFIKTALRRSGAAALRLYEKHSKVIAVRHKARNGTKSNMSWLWFDGSKDLWVRDFNNTKVFKLRS